MQTSLTAKMVHDLDQPPNRLSLIQGNINSTTRGFGIYKECWKEEPVLVISFRATKFVMEKITNLNGDLMPCEELGEEFKIHKGLGMTAMKTQDNLLAALDGIFENSTERWGILFTGHSGGDAIAQLLFGFMNSESTALSRIGAGM
jgi:hypothetical protein